MRSLTRPILLTLLILAPLAGCGDDAEPALDPIDPARAGLEDPEVPFDSLYGATAVENVRLTPVELEIPDLPAGWDGIRIATISDLQLGLWEDNEEVAAAAVQRAIEADPDLVVLLGDYLARGEDTEALARVLAPLRGENVLAVLGDRDIRSDTLQARITRTLERIGARVLNNDAVPFTRGEDTVFIAGVSPGLADEPVADQEWVLSQLAPGRTALLLSHVPGVVPRAPGARFPVALAGNTVCGPVEVPGTPRLSWLSEEVLPGALIPEQERLYLTDGTVLFVTCGVGYGFLPARLSAPPEVALVTLRGVGAPETQQPADTAVADTLLERYLGTAAPENTTGG